MITNDPRPDPDQLLARVKSEEQQKLRGKLKVFLGYAAGVGKTYAMLEAAHQRKKAGVDIVVGFVETHGRAETEALIADLEVIARKSLSYRGVTLAEMDIDAVLARRPKLVLVDELAHTNAPGSRHSKRFQDVEEFLLAGINVSTTLNVQHLESLNDVIAQITGIKVRETIPDSVIDQIDELELIDLPPEELLIRLKEGKVYVPEQASRAIQNFFRKGNLTALRELTMRRAAERVDDQMREYMQTKAIPGPWPATERLLVCVSSNPLAERLVRSTRRLADELNAEWLAVYVEVPEHAHLSEAQRSQITKTLLLAEELGGRSLSLSGRSVPEAILQYAHQHNITKVIIGRSLRPRWKDILLGSIVDQLVRSSGHIDVYIVSSEDETRPSPSYLEAWKPHSPLTRYLWAVFLIFIATAIGNLVKTSISPTNLVMIYLLAVVIAASYLGRGPSILVSLLGVLAFDFFLIPPYLTFAVADTEYFLTFITLFGVGLVISQLTARARDQAEVSKRREAETAILYALSRDLSIAEGLSEVVSAVIESISQTFGREAVLFLPVSQGDKRLKAYTHNTDNAIDPNEMAVAAWSYQHAQPAGRGTDTLSAAGGRYIPLITAKGVVGVLGVKPRNVARSLPPDQRRLLETFASQAALAIERAQLAEQAQYTQLLTATERLQTALLNSISHDLRTPLVSVIGALSSLVDDETIMDAENRQSLIENALEEADRMNRLVGNLLNMTRIEAGVMQVVKQPGDVQDVIGTALESFGERISERRIEVEVPESLPLIPMDFVLIVQVLVNLIDNSLKYSHPDTLIQIRAFLINDNVQIMVSDRGVGVPPGDLERIFDKFYRVQRPENISGTGLGLSISKGIIEAHGGRIWAEDRSGGGTIVSFTLPSETNSGTKA
jgi:two-component system sensor histidine kinase KdpD